MAKSHNNITKEEQYKNMKFWSQMPIKENPSMEDVLMLGDTLDVNNPKTITLQQMMDIAGEKVSSVEVVDELPAEGRENKLYIKKISQDDTYVYESYIWDDNAYHQMSNGGGGGGDSVWEKDSDNNIFPKGNTNVTGTNCFVTGLTSKADHNNNISIGNGNESKANNSIVIGVQAKDFDPSGDAIGWINLIAMGNNPVIPPKSYNVSYATWQNPKFIVGGLYGLNRWNTLEQTVNGDLYIKGINGWTGTNATPDGTSHLQGYLSGLDTRISNNTTAISGKQDTISAGNGIDVTNNVVSVDNTIAKKTDVYTKNETDSLLGGKQNTLTAGNGIDITNNIISATGGIDPSAYVRKANLEDSDPYIDPNGVVIASENIAGMVTVFDSTKGVTDQTNISNILALSSEMSYFMHNAPILEGEGYLTNPSNFTMMSGVNGETSFLEMGAQSVLPGETQPNKIGAIGIQPDRVQLNARDEANNKGSSIGVSGEMAGVASNDKVELKVVDSSDDSNTSIEITPETITFKANTLSTTSGYAETNAYTFTFKGKNTVNVSAPRFTHNSKEISVDPTLHHFSNNDSLTLEDNSIYTAIEKISAFVIDDWDGTSVVSFNTASSGAITITLPQTIKFAVTPIFGNDEHWEIAIRKGYAVYSKYNLA